MIWLLAALVLNTAGTLVTDTSGKGVASSAVEETMVVEATRVEIAPGRRALDREEIRKVPGSWGDPLRAVQNLPGTGRSFMGFFADTPVRGSAPEDTSLYVDGHLVPLLFHFGALRSMLNAQTIDSVEFLPGGFGAYYGRAVGGVLDAHTRTDVPERTRFHVQTDVADTGLFVQTPARSEFGGMAVSAAVRRSYLDAFVFPFQPNAVVPRYFDYLLKMDAGLGSGDDFGLLLFGSDDALITQNDEGEDESFLSTNFHRLQGRWRRQLGESRSVGGSFAAGEDRGLIQGGTSLRPRWNGGFRADYHAPIAERAALTVGLDLKGAYQRPGTLFDDEEEEDPPEEEEPDIRTRDPRWFNGEAGLYAEGEWRPFPGLMIVPGLRADWYGGIETWSIDPRLAVRYRYDDATTLLASTGVYHQSPRVGLLGIILLDAGALGILLPAERAVHAVAGVQRTVSTRAGFDLTGYYKYMDHVTEITLDPSGVNGEGGDQTLIDGRGRAYGMELMLRLYPSDGIFAWIAWSLSRAERLDPKTNTWFPFGYDQTHNVNAAVSWQFWPSVRLGGRFRFVTGNPYTPAFGSIYDADTGEYTPIEGARSSARLPPFVQVDVRLDKTWARRIWTFVLFADVMNATNRRNPEFAAYNFDYSRRRNQSGLPILPMLGFEAYR